MNTRILFTIAAVVGAIFGLAFLLAPDRTLAFYEVTLGDTGLAIARLLGATYVSFAAIAWFARPASASPLLKSVLLGFAISYTLSFLIVLQMQIQGMVNTMGWSSVVITALLALGFANEYLRQPKEKLAAAV
jgi:hypothetical protein